MGIEHLERKILLLLSVMLVIILESVGVPSAGIALILGVDRILDMLRTTVNVTGDATVAVIIAESEDQLNIPSK